MKKLRTAIGLAIALVISMAGTAASASAIPALNPGSESSGLAERLSGTWYNELGSVVKLTATRDGQLAGVYQSAVGNASGEYVLTGRFDAEPVEGEGVAIGWTVAWRNAHRDAHSVATWSGQFRADPKPVITTQWLLTTATTPENAWKSTQVGQNVFTRTPQTTDPAQSAKRFDLTSSSIELGVGSVN